MKYITQGGESIERFTLLLQLTNITSEPIIEALKDHLVTGLADATAASINCVPQSNFNRAFKSLNETATIVEKIKELDWAKFKSVNR
jgi:hypothetical protein